MVDPILRVLETGGWAAYLLTAVSLLLYFTATLRAFSLRRGFSGSVATLIRDLEDRGSAAAQVDSEALVPRFVAICLRRMGRAGACEHDLERWFGEARHRAEGHDALLHSLVAAAPMLGLLGTVNGMVETFASLHATTGLALTHATERTVAGGISTALITTQIGLIVGIPGLAVARVLRRLDARRRDELGTAHALLVQRLGEHDHGGHRH